jgi:hypothetical protein
VSFLSQIVEIPQRRESEGVHGGIHPAGDDLGREMAAASRVGERAAPMPEEDQLALFWAGDVEVVRDERFEEPVSVAECGEHEGAGDLDLAHRHPSAVLRRSVGACAVGPIQSPSELRRATGVCSPERNPRPTRWIQAQPDDPASVSSTPFPLSEVPSRLCPVAAPCSRMGSMLRLLRTFRTSASMRRRRQRTTVSVSSGAGDRSADMTSVLKNHHRTPLPDPGAGSRPPAFRDPRPMASWMMTVHCGRGIRWRSRPALVARGG